MKSHSHRHLQLVFRGLLILFAGLFLIASLSLVVLLRDYRHRAGMYELDRIADAAQRSIILDKNGEFHSYIHGENRLVVPLEKVSENFLKCLVAREDSRFWEHDGVDLRGIVRAAFTNLRSGKVEQGASTLTQQLARNTFQLGGRTYDRKLLEVFLARRIERQYDKKQILEHYVNRIYFGDGYYGVETASLGYFGKSAADLTLAEGATLAALICSPNRLAPTNNAAASKEERNLLLQRMADEGLLTEEEGAAAKAEPLHVEDRKETLRVQSDYVVDAVNRELQTLLTPEVIAAGGLRIHSTIDPDLQRTALNAANDNLKKIESRKGYNHPTKAEFDRGPTDSEEDKLANYLQTAVVVVENSNGSVRAIVGGRDYEESKYQRAMLAQRQIGSTFKPFVYAAAFERGMLPCSIVDDSRIDPEEFKNVSNEWTPENSDGRFLGLQRADFGLIKSRNTMAVRIGRAAGYRAVRKIALETGIGTSMKDYPVTFLGAFETDLLSLTGAYTIFPNHGEWRRPHLISRIEDNNGHTLFRRADAPRRVISAESAWMTSRALEKVLKVGTASKAGDLGWKKPAGGKTGTTDAFKDAWFVGYTSSLTCGVWVGMDKPQTIMRKGYGAELALPIWVDIMKSAPDWNYPARELKPAVAITQAPLCRKSGQRATTSCVHAGAAFYELLPATRVPTDTCELHRPHIATRSYPPTTETPTLYLQQQEPSPNPGSRQPAHIASQRTNVSRAEPHPPPSTPSARDLQASRSPAQTDSQREEADFPEPLPVRRATPATAQDKRRAAAREAAPPNASGRPREKVVYEQTPNGIRIWRIRPVHRRLTPNEEEEAPRTTQRHIPVRRAVPAIPGNAPTVAQLHDGDGELDD